MEGEEMIGLMSLIKGRGKLKKKNKIVRKKAHSRQLYAFSKSILIIMFPFEPFMHLNL